MYRDYRFPLELNLKQQAILERKLRDTAGAMSVLWDLKTEDVLKMFYHGIYDLPLSGEMLSRIVNKVFDKKEDDKNEN